VRKIVEVSGSDWSIPAPFADGQILAEALLTPTRIYVKPLLSALRAGIGIKALAHITGGGFIDNIPRVLPESLAAHVNLDAITPPPVFGWLSRSGGIESFEMLRTFNCGVGMLAAVAADDAETLVAHLNEAGETATIVGRLTERSGDAVTFQGSLKL
jgi:phosphoribosylformylglycinamidine cyclo-ligase